MVVIYNVRESLVSEPIAHVYLFNARYYLTDEEHLLSINERVAFCCVCRDFVPSEWLTAPLQEAAQYRRWRQCLDVDTSHLYTDEIDREMFGTSFYVDLLNRLKKDYRPRIRMLRNRQSPPRCLACGSTDIVQAQEARPDEEFFRLMHPDYLPDGLIVDGNGLGSGNWSPRLFNTEGEELRFTADKTQEIVRRLRS